MQRGRGDCLRKGEYHRAGGSQRGRAFRGRAFRGRGIMSREGGHVKGGMPNV